jgi:hypothetical protein
MRLHQASRRLLSGEWCVYCGEYANEQDHFPPSSIVRIGWVLPACRECNAIASVKHPWDFEARCAWVKHRLAIRHVRAARMPAWYAAELRELGADMRREVSTWLAKQKRLKSRLAWSAEDYLLNIDPSSDFAQWLAEINTITKTEKRLSRNLDACEQAEHSRQCEVCGADLDPARRRYCSKQCVRTALGV